MSGPYRPTEADALREAGDRERRRLEEAHERRIVRCRSQACRARIIWLDKANGPGKMPVDADTVEPADAVFDRERHTSHFATCPDAASFRKGKGKR